MLALPAATITTAWRNVGLEHRLLAEDFFEEIDEDMEQEVVEQEAEEAPAERIAAPIQVPDFENGNINEIEEEDVENVLEDEQQF